MGKTLRQNREVHLAYGIHGHLDEDFNAIVIDDFGDNIKTPRNLDIYSIDDKITIYERQVKEWFIIRADKLRRSKNKEQYMFIIMMILISYIEGVQQYMDGESSEGRSREVFIKSFERIFPEYKTTGNQGRKNYNKISELYSNLRCELFHNGIVGSKLMLTYEEEVEGENRTENHRDIQFRFSVDNPFYFKMTGCYEDYVQDIFVNIKYFSDAVLRDFDKYIGELRNPENHELRNNFNYMFNI